MDLVQVDLVKEVDAKEEVKVRVDEGLVGTNDVLIKSLDSSTSSLRFESYQK